MDNPLSNHLDAGPLDSKAKGIKTRIAHIASVGTKVRETLIRRAVEQGDFSSRLPGCVRIEFDAATLLNRRLLDDGLHETRQRPAILASGADPYAFEVLTLEALRTEAGELFEQLDAALKATDPSRQLLVLSASPIHLREDGKAVPHHLIRMNADRAHVALKGIPLVVPEPAGGKEAEA